MLSTLYTVGSSSLPHQARSKYSIILGTLDLNTYVVQSHSFSARCKSSTAILPGQKGEDETQRPFPIITPSILGLLKPSERVVHHDLYLSIIPRESILRAQGQTGVVEEDLASVSPGSGDTRCYLFCAFANEFIG